MKVSRLVIGMLALVVVTGGVAYAFTRGPETPPTVSAQAPLNLAALGGENAPMTNAAAQATGQSQVSAHIPAAKPVVATTTSAKVVTPKAPATTQTAPPAAKPSPLPPPVSPAPAPVEPPGSKIIPAQTQSTDTNNSSDSSDSSDTSDNSNKSAAKEYKKIASLILHKADRGRDNGD